MFVASGRIRQPSRVRPVVGCGLGSVLLFACSCALYSLSRRSGCFWIVVVLAVDFAHVVSGRVVDAVREAQ